MLSFGLNVPNLFLSSLSFTQKRHKGADQYKWGNGFFKIDLQLKIQLSTIRAITKCQNPERVKLLQGEDTESFVENVHQKVLELEKRCIAF